MTDQVSKRAPTDLLKAMGGRPPLAVVVGQSDRKDDAILTRTSHSST